MTNYGYQPYGGYPQYPYGYQTQMQQRGQMAMQQPQQPMQMQPQQQPMPMQYEIPLRETKFVTSEEAKAYIVMPNSAVLLIDKNAGMAYLKSADQMGQSFMESYSFKKYDQNAQTQETAQNQTEKQEPIDLSKFVTKDDLGALQFATKDDLQNLGFVRIEEYEKLKQTVDMLKKNATGVKPNVATATK